MQSTTRNTFLVYLILICLISSCTGQNNPPIKTISTTEPLYFNASITVGAERFNDYFPLLANKKIGLIVNQTSMIGRSHLADTLLSLNIDVKKIFAPEHGFRGDADAGETVKNGLDIKTGLPIISLYGQNKKPTIAQIEDLDILVFDIQDVGARFYTYISTMHYIMEAAAENGKSVIVLDRPNPNGHYVAGPVMMDENKSFVGMHHVPIVHGMTVGEYAKMINGELWLANKIQCDLTVIPCLGYDHKKFYELPVKPSPNLPNMEAIYFYPTLCLFEGTDISVGRGTDKQFQVIGSPNISTERLGTEFFNLKAGYKFIPEPKPGAKTPPHEGQECWGFDLSKTDVRKIREMRNVDYQYIQAIYQLHTKKEEFFNDYFIKLSGTNALKDLIINPKKAPEILLQFESQIEAFKKIRSKYLLYKDFE